MTSSAWAGSSVAFNSLFTRVFIPLLGVGALGLVGLAGALAGTSSSKGEDPSTRPDDSSKTPEPPDSGRVDVHDHSTRID